MSAPTRLQSGIRLLAATLFLVASGVPDVPARAETSAREGEFTARWVVSGTWRAMGLGGSREVILADLTGRLDVTHGSGDIVDLSTRCLVYWDSAKSGSGSCRWRHPSGDEIFVEIEGGLLAPNKSVSGRLIGGTGRYAGISGEFAFDKWNALQLDREERSGEPDELSGRTLTAFTQELAGRWRAGAR